MRSQQENLELIDHLNERIDDILCRILVGPPCPVRGEDYFILKLKRLRAGRDKLVKELD